MYKTVFEDNYIFLKEGEKIVAHLPLRNYPIKDDVLLLPDWREEVDVLAEKYAYYTISEFSIPLKVNELVHASKRDFINGFKKAQELSKDKLFTLEDVEKAIKLTRKGWDEWGFNGEFRGHKFEFTNKEIIQKLQQSKLPKEFVLGEGSDIEGQIKNGEWIF